MDTSKFNKLLVHPKFHETVSEINKLDIKLPLFPTSEEMNFSLYPYPENGQLVTNIEDIKNYTLDAKNGDRIAHRGSVISAYDESMKNYAALEGSAYLTSHSLVIQSSSEYLTSNYLTLYFYTRARDLTSEMVNIKYSEVPGIDNTIDYVKDRHKFILENVPKNSILFIDGPLIGSNAASYTVKLNEMLLNENIIPIFVVKNSDSTMVVGNIKELKSKYNSDLHWASRTLKQGQRSSLFKYEDVYNKKNSKIFCYIQPFNQSPQRIEIHTDTLNKYKNVIVGIFDLIYYLMLAQGDPSNPQIRTIAIAEKFARATSNLVNLPLLLKSAGLISTVNQERFGWN